MATREQSTFERLRGESLNRKEPWELHRRLFTDDPGLEIPHPGAAGIDIGNERRFVSVLPERDPEPVREFGSWTMDLERMAVWMKSCGIKTVAKQSTGVHWIAAYDVLEKHGLEVFLGNSRDTRNLPGRKTDVRTTWRVRARLVEDASRHVQHRQKALTTMNVQLANVVSDITGLTGQAIVRTILKGERNIYVLADLRDARVKASREEIARSLEGNWREDVLFELKQAVDAYAFVQKQTGECDRELEKYVAALPSRSLPGSDAEETAAGGKKKQKSKKPRGTRRSST